jgi:hypothetical protein
METDEIKVQVHEFNTALEIRLADENFVIEEPGVFYMDNE